MEKVIKKIQIKGCGSETDLRMEKYDGCGELYEMISTRDVAKGFSSSRIKEGNFDSEFTGVKSRKQLSDYMTTGWGEHLSALKQVGRLMERDSKIIKPMGFKNDVVGFQPLIPQTLMGLPQCMVNHTPRPRNVKVVNVVYSQEYSAYVDYEHITKIGLKIMERVMRIEKMGYRVELYNNQFYADSPRLIHCVSTKCKSAEMMLDMKRVLFPMFHPGMFRLVGFGWYETFPESKYIDGYGRPINFFMSKEQIDDLIAQIYGPNTMHVQGMTVLNKGMEKIDETLDEIFGVIA